MKRVPSIKYFFQKRPRRWHKYRDGHVVIMGGSQKYSGAPILAARAAFRSGAGLVSVASPEVITPIIQKTVPEAINLPLSVTQSGDIKAAGLKKILADIQKSDCLVIGPGLKKQKNINGIIKEIVIKAPKGVLIDAGALPSLPGIGTVIKKRKLPPVITPHAGEFSKLTGLPASYIEKNKVELSKQYAAKWGVIVVLKGYRTVISDPRGNQYIDANGGPELATAGSGDVLSGIIAALIARRPNNIFSGAVLGVYMHSLAGQAAAKKLNEQSVMARDVIENIPIIIRKLIHQMGA